MIEQADFLFRLMAIGAGLLLVAQIVAGEVRSAIKLPLVGLVVGVIGYLINSAPLMAPWGPIGPWIDLVSISVPFSIWLFARNLFEREPDSRIILGSAAILLAGWALGNFVPGSGLLGFYVLHFAALGLIADLVRVGLFERTDDLVEQRRIIRLWLPLLVALQAGGVLLFEMFEALTDSRGSFPIVNLANSLMILIMMLFSGLTLLRTDPELLVESEQEGARETHKATDLTPSEQVLHDRLVQAMEGGTYRETGLTIAALADHLDTPEHRLRALINQRLGYRNFSAFLNRYRIAEAREKLASREDVDLPVLTIAMDLGYNSLPTFNRAFRAETGTTPREFRRQSFNGEAQDHAVQK